jgi:signal peptidase I
MKPRAVLRTLLPPLAIAIFLALALRSMVRVYAIPSASMQPTLRAGDHIVVVPDRHPAPGDVVVFRSPGAPDELMVKRVIAAPGDLIASANGRVTIGSHTLAEPYLTEAAATGSIQPQIVPAGCYFVLGDNRASSWDSRNWGILPSDLVVGRAVMVLWSSPESSLRFDRLFKPIR